MTTTQSERTAALERTAFEAGLAAGLEELFRGIDPASHAPGPYAAVPAGLAGPSTKRLPHSLAEAEGITLIETGPDTGRASRSRHLWHPLAAVRLGVVRRLLREATQHLGERESGGTPLIHMQLLRGQVADLAAEIDELSHTLRATGSADSALLGAQIHGRISELSWGVGKFFGAAGFIATHTARAHYVSSLVANTWVPDGDSSSSHSTTPERNSLGC